MSVEFDPKDNPITRDAIDWRRRYEELESTRDWDEKRDFVGLKRLGSHYRMVEPFFKFESVPEEKRLYDKLWKPSIFASLMCVSGVMTNMWALRPMFANVPMIVGLTVLGGLTGHGIQEWITWRANNRDAVLKHYMILHEHEFPIVERKKFGQIVQPWYPFRTIAPSDSY